MRIRSPRPPPGPRCPDRARLPNIAPMTENTKMEPNIERSNHAAKVGRERGRESPISVSPARAALAGRNAPSPNVCVPISAMPIPAAAAPMIPYWMRRDPLAPAITPTPITAVRPKQGRTTTLEHRLPRVQMYVSCSASARSTSSPAAHRCARRNRRLPGRNTTNDITNTATPVTTAAST